MNSNTGVDFVRKVGWMKSRSGSFQQRSLWIDILRIVATWGVISIHGKSCYDFEIGTYRWIEYGIISFTFSFCVPVFLMLSGYLSLRKEVTIEATLKKRVPRVVLMKLISLGLCAVAGGMYAFVKSEPVFLQVKTSVSRWGYGTSYLAVLLGCYLVTPFLYKIIENRKYEEYFLVLSAIFCFIVPSFVDLDYVRNTAPGLINSVMDWLDYGQVYVPVGSAALFVLGHYLGIISEKVNKRKSIVFLIIGFLLWASSGFWQIMNPDGNSILSVLRYGRYYGSYVSPLLTIYSASVFLCFKTIMGGEVSGALCELIHHLGRNSVLIFLLHGIVISCFRPLIPVFWCKSFLVETVADVTFYFVIAFGISLILERIPIINKMVDK